MNDNLIEKLLNEQTTPEEEHLIAQMLRHPQSDEACWLTDDETAVYDRIVSQRHARRTRLRWAAAAAIVLVLAVGTLVLWPRHTKEQQVATITVATGTSAEPNQSTSASVAQPRPTAAPVAAAPEPATPKIAPRQVAKRAKAHQASTHQPSVTDSLQYYIARLEKELETVNENTYADKAEEVIRADARLQRLVQRIMIGELTRSDEPSAALNTNITMEEQP